MEEEEKRNGSRSEKEKGEGKRASRVGRSHARDHTSQVQFET